MANTLSANLQTLLDNRLRYLPPLVGDAINSIDWSSKIIEIGHTMGMHVDEMEDFQAVVLKSMIGLIAPADFERELVASLALSPANADKVIHQINAQIFEPIHDYVLRGGKSEDLLKQSGIHLETEMVPPSTLPKMQDSKPVSGIEFGGELSATIPPRPTATPPIIGRDPAPAAEDLFAKYFGSQTN